MTNYKNRKWNSGHTKYAMEKLQKEIEDKKLDIDLEYPYIDKLCNQTNSKRIQQLIEEAYYLGMAKGIMSIENGMNFITPSENLIDDCK